MNRRSLLLLAAPLLLAAGCQQQNSTNSVPAPGPTGAPSAATTPMKSGPSIAFVTNQIADFWKIAEAGCVAASKEFGVEVQVIMPPEASAVVQQQKVEDAIATGIRGIAISPLDADNQIEWINSLCSKMPTITHDSDAPLLESARVHRNGQLRSGPGLRRNSAEGTSGRRTGADHHRPPRTGQQ